MPQITQEGFDGTRIIIQVFLLLVQQNFDWDFRLRIGASRLQYKSFHTPYSKKKKSPP